jgi:polysaccharide export outer membrane protein
MMRAVLFATLFLAATAWAQSEKLGVGDAIRVTVFQQPDMTTEARISEKGTVSLPLIGEQKVAGKSLPDAGKQIAGALKEGKYLKDPQVQVTLVTLRSRQISVLGQVARPGLYPLDDASMGITQVLAAAGGVLPTGADSATLLRGGKQTNVDVKGKDAAFQLQPGDTVYVERAPVFYVYGEVTRSGAYRVEQNMTVMQAIAAGGGITPRGSDRRVKLRRNGPDGKVVETDAKLSDVVKADDVIYVKEALF